MAVTVAPASTRGNSPDPVSWVVASRGDDTVVTVEGELGLASAGAFAAALAAVGAGGSRAVVDMARLETIDAGALDGLVRVKRLFEILGLALVIRAPSPHIAQRLVQFDLAELIEAR
jgi:anti-anti-sigma regulatory factor